MLAHQGGWDEILMILVPMAVIVGLLSIARRRVTRVDADTDRDDVPADPVG